MPGRKQYPSSVGTDGSRANEEARQQRRSSRLPRWSMRLNRKRSTGSVTTFTDEPESLRKKSSLQSYLTAEIKTDLVRCSSPEEYFAIKADELKPKRVGKKLLVSTSTGLTSVLATTIVIGEATNLPYLKGIAGIATLIIRTSEATKDNQKDYSRMRNMLIELQQAVQNHVQSGDVSPLLRRNMETLEGVVSKVSQFLEAQTQRKYLMRFMTAKSTADSLDDCEKDLEHALSLFQFRSNVGTAAAIKRRDTKDGLDFQHTLQSLDNLRQGIHRAREMSISDKNLFNGSISPMDLPPPPQIFYGRDAEFSHIISSLQRIEQTTLCICGAGGIGKSSLALALIHQHEVVELFGSRRYFISCTSTTSLDDLLQSIAAALGFSGLMYQNTSTDPQHVILHSLSCSPDKKLIILDNFDNTWEPHHSRHAVEDFLTKLSATKTVSTIVTLRGIRRPSGPNWTKPHLAPLTPLSRDAARDTFIAISDLDPCDPYVDTLIESFDCLPLPITLMAHLAQYESPYSLIDRYRSEGTGMVSRGRDRETDLNSSIKFSLDRHSITECPGALELLRTLSSFPGGIPECQLISLVPPSILNPRKCISILREMALVYEDGDDDLRLHVYAPIRAYMCPEQLSDTSMVPDLGNCEKGISESWNRF